LKRTIEPGEIPDTWDAEALYNKAQRYAQRMIGAHEDDWEYALWSSLSLELLARSALSNVNPALLADPENWSNLYYALGFTPTEARFSPKSIPVSEVIKRFGSIFPSFNQELQSFCTVHTGRRNAELHSGETPLDGVSRSSWLPRFYQACSAILASMDLDLEDFVGNEEAEVAQKLIDAATDESAKAVRGDVAAHRKVWLAKDHKEQAGLLDGARAFATRSAGHRVVCPACGSPALVHGEAINAPTKRLEDDLIIESQDHLPTHFQCVACGLKVLGLSRLNAIGLGDRFTTTYSFDAAEYFAPADDMPEYDDDNNEYYGTVTRPEGQR
jgi:hypothetical protein